MKRYSFHIAFGLGALAVLWVAAAVATSHLLVLIMAAVIGGVYVFGAMELRQYRAATAALSHALSEIPQDLQNLNDWLITLPPGLQNPIRQRVEGERVGLPGPALTPYLVGLLVMLGMLGTFLGMVVTLNGAVFALEGSTNVAGIRAFAAAFGTLPQVACFDTAFHRTLSPLETTFAIDKKLTEQGVRRYGFHGLSYQYVSQVLKREVPRASGRVVMAHLGNGASVCATTGHQSRATTMGFSARSHTEAVYRCSGARRTGWTNWNPPR